MQKDNQQPLSSTCGKAIMYCGGTDSGQCDSAAWVNFRASSGLSSEDLYSCQMRGDASEQSQALDPSKHSWVAAMNEAFIMVLEWQLPQFTTECGLSP